MARGRFQTETKAAEVKSRKRVEVDKPMTNNSTYSLSIIGIANSVELFKGEIGKGGTMHVRKS